jgi:hypothetical protein
MKTQVRKHYILRGTSFEKSNDVVVQDDGIIRFPAILATEAPGIRYLRDPETGAFCPFDEIIKMDGMDLSRGKKRNFKMYYCHNSADLALGDWNNVAADLNAKPCRLLRAQYGNFKRKDGVATNRMGMAQPLSAVRESLIDGSLDSVSIGYDTFSEFKIIRQGSEWEGIKATVRDAWVWLKSQLIEASLVPEPFDVGALVGRDYAGRIMTPESIYEMTTNGDEEANFECEIVKHKVSIVKTEPETGDEPMDAKLIREHLATLDEKAQVEFLHVAASETINGLIITAREEGKKEGIAEEKLVSDITAKDSFEKGKIEGRSYHDKFVELAKYAAENPDKWVSDPISQKLFNHYGKTLEIVKAIADTLVAERAKPVGGKPAADVTESKESVKTVKDEDFIKAFGNR